jgi:3-hydroxybutyryl-CoA dehydrogenase
MVPKDVKRILVVGAGVMGHTIAPVFAQAGFETTILDLNENLLKHALNMIKSNLTTLAEFGKFAPADIPAILNRLHTSTGMATAAKRADFVMECVPEVPAIKKEVFSQLEEFCPRDTILASNTSGLDVFTIADLKEPGRLVIAHWYTPAHIIPLVDVVPGPKTSQATTRLTANLMERIGKKPVTLREYVPGFIVNQFQNALAITAFKIIDNGWASPEEIDRALKLTLGIRLPIVGIMQNMDFNGIDICQQIFARLGRSVSYLDDLVRDGHLGAKTSHGFYDYGGRNEEEIVKKRDIQYLKMLDHLSKIGAFEPV